MTEISFYQLTSSSPEIALPRLMEKVYGSGKRAVILVRDQEKLEEFNRALWTYHPHRFLPHGSVKDGNAEDQPIFLSAGPAAEHPNGAEILVLADAGEFPDFGGFSRILKIFDGNDKESLANARESWKKYKSANYDLSYFRQDEKGKWDKVDL